MKSNSLITYVIYALLLGLILVAGYKACQIRQEQAQRQKENAELDQVMRDLGYSSDSTANGSSYLGSSDSTAKTTAPSTTSAPKTSTTTTAQPKVSASGIEDEPVKSSTASKTSAPPLPSSTPGATKPVTAVKPTTTAKSPGLTTKAPTYSGKYLVFTGAFRDVSNARDEMETLVKAGYLNAEVRTAAGWSKVIALRSNDRAAADRAMEKLKSEGYPSAYVKAQ